ncbi:MAG: hypothetical protein E7534_02150 [Ruminococcaceae bacterium]|nr:hypothetical protein [Oscillospiraceae bacterium]MBQ2780175.1 hypothetical protein [Clostridia bacterium]MBQ7303106.1 hypothetical protein [Clostridia bacterium]
MPLLRKCVRYIPAALCLALCLAMPFLMLYVEQQLEWVLDGVTGATVTVTYVDADGKERVAKDATVQLGFADAVITTADGEEIQVPASALGRRPAPDMLFSKSTLIAVVATVVTGSLLTFMLIPFNAYLIQFSIEHTPDGKFAPFEVA